jgi:hypothetical protein
MNRTLYISRECIHCKKLLLGIHKYDFLKPMFNFIDVNSNPYPDYIKSVPTLVIDQNIIRGDDVFDYLNKIVGELLKQGQQGQQQGQQGQQQPANLSSNNVEDNSIIGWCVDDSCMFSELSDSNDDCANQCRKINDIKYSYILDDVSTAPINHSKVPMETSNEQFTKSAKQQQMDASYERLMAERNLIK